MSRNFDQRPIIKTPSKTWKTQFKIDRRFTNISYSFYYCPNWSESKDLTSITSWHQMTDQIMASSAPSGGQFLRLADWEEACELSLRRQQKTSKLKLIDINVYNFFNFVLLNKFNFCTTKSGKFVSL